MGGRTRPDGAPAHGLKPGARATWLPRQAVRCPKGARETAIPRAQAVSSTVACPLPACSPPACCSCPAGCVLLLRVRVCCRCPRWRLPCLRACVLWLLPACWLAGSAFFDHLSLSAPASARGPARGEQLGGPRASPWRSGKAGFAGRAAVPGSRGPASRDRSPLPLASAAGQGREIPIELERWGNPAVGTWGPDNACR